VVRSYRGDADEVSKRSEGHVLLLHPPLVGFKFSRLVLYGWMAALHQSQLLGRGALLSKLYEKDRLQRAPERILLLEFRRNETNASKLTGNLMHGSHYLFGLTQRNNSDISNDKEDDPNRYMTVIYEHLSRINLGTLRSSSIFNGMKHVHFELYC